jgi:hypothetical protein
MRLSRFLNTFFLPVLPAALAIIPQFPRRRA